MIYDIYIYTQSCKLDKNQIDIGSQNFKKENFFFGQILHTHATTHDQKKKNFQMKVRFSFSRLNLINY